MNFSSSGLPQPFSASRPTGAMANDQTQQGVASQRMRTQADCILCGKCLEVCPLFAATGREELSPRGKSFLIRQARQKDHPFDPTAVRKLLGLCLGCGRCAEVCPQERNLPKLLQEVRAGHPGWQSWFWRTWITRARQLWPFFGRCAGLLPEVAAVGPVEALRLLSRPPQVSGVLRRVASSADLPQKTILFPGCMARFARPWWMQNALKMLGQAGTRLETFPEWHCCGFTVAQAGLHDLQAAMQARNVSLWREQGRPALVTLCASCTTALRGYAETLGLFHDDRERTAWTAAVQPLSSILIPEHFQSVGQKPLLYHRPCHAPEPDPDLAFLQVVLGDLVNSDTSRDCCGMGGAMQLCAPRLAAQVSTRYWRKMPAGEDRFMTTGCSGCVLQLSATAPQGTVVTHWLELLTL